MCNEYPEGAQTVKLDFEFLGIPGTTKAASNRYHNNLRDRASKTTLSHREIGNR